MTDIVERLQATGNDLNRQWPCLYGSMMLESASEIERLREALRAMADHPTGGVGCNPEGFVNAARAALTKGK